MLNDGQVWERHLDHIRRDDMDSGDFNWNNGTYPVQQGTFDAGVLLPEQLTSSTPVMQTVDLEALVQMDNVSDSQSATGKSTSLETTSPEAEQAALHRSGRVLKAFDRLIMTM